MYFVEHVFAAFGVALLAIPSTIIIYFIAIYPRVRKKKIDIDQELLLTLLVHIVFVVLYSNETIMIFLLGG